MNPKGISETFDEHIGILGDEASNDSGVIENVEMDAASSEH